MSNNPFDDDYVSSPFEEYIVLSGTYVDIGQKVKGHLRAGWKLQGGVSVAGPAGQMQFYQAMYHPYLEQNKKPEK